MPTGPGQPRIATPWDGPGSIANAYGREIAEDRKPSDGWELLFSTFDPTDTSPLLNPYFILYNKYRGLMRIFYYITTNTSTSANLQNGILINFNVNTRLFNFLESDIVLNPTATVKNYYDIQSLQISTGSWYMMEYEIAYDENVGSLNTSQITWGFDLKYYDVATINISGEARSEISGYIGVKSSSNIFSNLTNLGTVVSTGVLGAAGMKILEKNPKVFSDSVYKKIYSGMQKAVESMPQNLPGAALKLLSAIVGGSSDPTPISMKMNTQFRAEGTALSSGSLRGASMMIPGSQVSSSYTWQIPYYNKPLGVFTLKETPTIPITTYYRNWMDPDPMYGNDMFYYTTSRNVLPDVIDYSSLIIVNPEVSAIADFNILAQELLLIRQVYDGSYIDEGNNEQKYYRDDITVEPERTIWYESYTVNSGYPPVEFIDCKHLAVRFNIEVKPKDGSPSAMLYKTFKLTPQYTVIKQ